MALDPKYMFSPNLQEFFIDPNTNLPLTAGFVNYFKDKDRATRKTVYELSGSYNAGYNFTPLPNPLELGGAGTTVNESGADIRVYYYPYDENGVIENYYITVTDDAGNEILSRQAWPNLSSTSSAATSYNYNFVRNNTFNLWNYDLTESLNVKTGSTNLTDFIIPDWTYEQDDDSQDIDIVQGTFSSSDSDVPGNPINYLIYRNNNSGSKLGTFNRFRQTYQGVKTLSGQNVAASIWINQVSGSSGQFSLTLTQDYGSGGSAPVPTDTTNIIFEPTLTVGDWVQYAGSATLPSVAGKTIGTNNYLVLGLNMPLNKDAEIYMTEIRLNQGITVLESTEVSNDDLIKQTNSIGRYPAWTTGDVKMTVKATADVAWLMMDDGTIGAPLSGSVHTGFNLFPLYNMLWNNIGDLFYTPIFTSAGELSTFGASASQDWQDGKRLALTKSLGRVLAGAAPTGVNFSFYYNYPGTGNFLNLVSPYITTGNIYRGTPIVFGSGAPTGITPGNTYYAIPTGPALEVASSVANAIAGTVIPLSGGPVTNKFFSVSLAAAPFGSFIGEDSHLQLNAELAAHNHTHGTLAIANSIHVKSGSIGAGADVYLTNDGAGTPPAPPISVDSGSTANDGGTTRFNIVDPRSYYNVMIKL